MGQLPIKRIQPSPPFWTVEVVDFFGPYTIRGEVQKRIKGKCFGVIIVCFVSRAVYVDISHDYSTDALLPVLRFATLKGWPRKICSDNGSQLVAASKELRNAIKDLNWKEIERYGEKHGIEWEFSPADAPWHNGAIEYLVKPVKRALNAAIEEEVMSFSELQTVMFEAAQIVNQRPKGVHPTCPEECPYLCPNDLVLGRSTSHVPQ